MDTIRISGLALMYTFTYVSTKDKKTHEDTFYVYDLPQEYLSHALELVCSSQDIDIKGSVKNILYFFNEFLEDYSNTKYLISNIIEDSKEAMKYLQEECESYALDCIKDYYEDDEEYTQIKIKKDSSKLKEDVSNNTITIGDKIIISDDNKAWNNKTGIVESMDNDECVVLVNFNEAEDKKVRQTFKVDKVKKYLKEEKETTTKRDSRGRFAKMTPSYDKEDYALAQKRAYELLKSKKPFAVIYAYSQGNGKVLLNKPLIKNSMKEVQDFADSFKTRRQGTKVVLDVFYLSQLDSLKDTFEESLEEKTINGDDYSQDEENKLIEAFGSNAKIYEKDKDGLPEVNRKFIAYSTQHKEYAIFVRVQKDKYENEPDAKEHISIDGEFYAGRHGWIYPIDFNRYVYIDELELKESMNEKTVKRNGKWVNVGKDGKADSGKFKTKKEADAQRKAMFANGYKESKENLKNKLDKLRESMYTNNDKKNHLNSIHEEEESMTKKEALAKYLGVTLDDIIESDYDENEFDVLNEDSEYLVLTYDEAYDRAVEYVKDTYDEMGLDAFTKSFRDWILENALDEDAFEDAVDDLAWSICSDKAEEYSTGEFGSELIEDAYDNDLLTDDDFEKDEDGEIDYSTLKDSVNLDDIEEQMVEIYKDTARDEIKDSFDLTPYIDVDKVAEAAVDEDGVAHFLASYDGEEIELDGDWYAYRIN